jgi:hypothetical protein
VEPRSFDGASRVLAALLPRAPGTARLLASAIGGLRNRVTRRWPETAEVRALFSPATPWSALRIAAGMGGLHERNRMFVRAIARHGVEALRPLVELGPGLYELRGPAILATFHVGAVHAQAPALERLQAPVLALRRGPLFAERPRLAVVSTAGDEEQRALALHRARRHLEAGGMVALALDHPPGPVIETRCLGRTLALAPGAFALANWTGAPILPLTARWTSRAVRVDSGPQVDSPPAAAQWLERYLVESPSETTLGLMRALLAKI